MARTELPNGIILPAEYSDDWYDDMTSNLSKLDEVIGSDAEKLSAENVGAAALSNDYDDLDNKPALKPVATSGDYDDLDNKPDLNPYDQHLANTEIHVTTADKQKWNDNVSQSYVLRYASTSVTPSSTIAYSVLNNTDNIKAGDSVIDAAGQVFLIASVDSANQTVTVSAVLLTLALDANVMHLSGNESVNGEKAFNDLQIIGYGTQYKGARDAYILPEFAAGYSGLSITTLSFSQTLKIGSFILDSNNKPTLDTSKAYIQVATGASNSVNTCVLEPRNSTYSLLGTSSNKWKQLNGLTPSSLSLPDDTYIDISGYITDLSGGSNQYIAQSNGLIAVDISNTDRYVLYNNNLGIGDRISGSNIRRSAIIPVRENDTVIIQSNGGTVVHAKFIPYKGNV